MGLWNDFAVVSGPYLAGTPVPASQRHAVAGATLSIGLTSGPDPGTMKQSGLLVLA